MKADDLVGGLAVRDDPPAMSITRGVSFEPHPTVCEVTCRWCGKPFEVMRLRHGRVRCPACHRPQGFCKEDVNWRAVPCS